MTREPEGRGSAPVCTLRGGPNGSGKSSLYRALAPPGEFVNTDLIARAISPDNPDAATLRAGRAVLGRLEDLVDRRRDFAWETTPSSNQARALMRRVFEAGYEIGLVFVTLASVDLNVDRVAQRVSQGGHHIPETVIRRRYDAAFEKLARAIRAAHATAIFDNTGRTPNLLLHIVGGVIAENRLDASQPLHLRICGAVAEAIAMNPDAVFGAARDA